MVILQVILFLKEREQANNNIILTQGNNFLIKFVRFWVSCPLYG
jgi:hypothetical protein